MTMTSLFSVGRMLAGLRAADKRAALRKLAIEISRDAGLPAPTVVDAVMRTADLPTFGPARGIALPHVFIPGLRHPLAGLATLTPALDFDAADGSRTDLVTLLLSPQESPQDHLRALAWIARRLRDRRVREHLRASNCREAMYVVLLGNDHDAIAMASTGRRSEV